MLLDLSLITNRQKLTIAKGLLDYQYIMNYWKTDCVNADTTIQDDFRSVYYGFYLKARWAKMGNEEYQNEYFQLLHSSPQHDLMTIIDIFKNKSGDYEFSICSKLLHTINPTFPIYDSKVRIFLKNKVGLDFWYLTGRKASKTTEEKIKNDWTLLCTWYRDFIKTTEGKDWIAWFDVNFPGFQSISDVKKIDFIIFATT